jgi:hypothetical protein
MWLAVSADPQRDWLWFFVVHEWNAYSEYLARTQQTAGFDVLRPDLSRPVSVACNRVDVSP